MTRKSRYFIFAFTALLLSTVMMVIVVAALDIYLHRRHAKDAALNIWGYRGPSVGSKRNGEQRIVVLGGSTTFGYGVHWDEAVPPLLERKLNARRLPAGELITVVNLGYNGEGAYSFKYTLRDYEYLQYDLIILYTGYNDLGDGPNRTVVRHESPVFRLTGYMPIFPLVFREKAMALRYGGRLEAAYRGEKTRFVPNARQRATAGALEAAVEISSVLERQLGRLTDPDQVELPSGPNACGERWSFYCHQVVDAVTYGRSKGKRVLVVGQPYISDGHVIQQRSLESMLRTRFGADRGVRLIDLGKVVDLRDADLSYDGMHLTVAGNNRIAESLVTPVSESLLPQAVGDRSH